MESTPTIEVHVNGEAQSVEQGTTVSALLAEKDIRIELVAVEINGEILQRDLYDSTELQSGDRVEWLFYMAGGL